MAVKKHKEFQGGGDAFDLVFDKVVCFIEDYLNELSKQKEMPDVYLDTIGGLNVEKLDCKIAPKRLTLSGENVFYDNFWDYQSKIIRYLNRICKQVLNFDIEKSGIKFPKKKFRMRLHALKNIEKFLIRTPSKKEYALLCNDLKSDHILNFPYFFYFCFDCFENFITVKNKKVVKKKFCAFVVSNETAKDRIAFFYKLSKYKKVDSYGALFNNARIPESLIEKYKFKNARGDSGKNRPTDIYNTIALNRELFGEYKFVICFENSYANDYITEKLPNVMLANSIGIYRGAGNIGEFFNTKSFINYDDYGCYDLMINKIIELDRDDEKYSKFLEQPFFVNNELPPRIKTLKQDLRYFLKRMVED